MLIIQNRFRKNENVVWQNFIASNIKTVKKASLAFKYTMKKSKTKSIIHSENIIVSLLELAFSL